MPHQNLSPQVILMVAIVLLILIVFVIMVIGSLASIFSEERTKAESDSTKRKTRDR